MESLRLFDFAHYPLAPACKKFNILGDTCKPKYEYVHLLVKQTNNTETWCCREVSWQMVVPSAAGLTDDVNNHSKYRYTKYLKIPQYKSIQGNNFVYFSLIQPISV